MIVHEGVLVSAHTIVLKLCWHKWQKKVHLMFVIVHCELQMTSFGVHAFMEFNKFGVSGVQNKNDVIDESLPHRNMR